MSSVTISCIGGLSKHITSCDSEAGVGKSKIPYNLCSWGKFARCVLAIFEQPTCATDRHLFLQNVSWYELSDGAVCVYLIHCSVQCLPVRFHAWQTCIAQHRDRRSSLVKTCPNGSPFNAAMVVKSSDTERSAKFFRATTVAMS